MSGVFQYICCFSSDVGPSVFLPVGLLAGRIICILGKTMCVFFLLLQSVVLFAFHCLLVAVVYSLNV